MDFNAGDPFCRIWYTMSEPTQSSKHQLPMSAEPQRTEMEHSSCPCGGPESAPNSFRGQILLGNTSIESAHYTNPRWLWNLKEQHTVAGMGRRGWVVVQVLDRDKFDDEVIGTITINLDEINQEQEIAGWYAVDEGSTDAFDTPSGAVYIRILLSRPQLYDISKSWLLSDFDVVLIERTAAQLVAVTGEDPADNVKDKRTIQNRRADASRLRWHANELMDRAFFMIDTDADGELQASELAVIMVLLGEPLTLLELGRMIAECKAWGADAEAWEETLATVLDEDGLKKGADTKTDSREPTSKQRAAHIAAERVLLNQLGNLGDVYKQPIELDLDHPIMTVTRAEFKTMLATYWTSRKMVSMATDGTPTKITPDEWMESGESDVQVQVMRNGEVVKDDEMVTHDAEKPRWCGQTELPVPIIHDLPPCPAWMVDIAKRHTRLEKQKRNGTQFWWVLTVKVEQILIKSERAGHVQKPLFDPNWKDAQGDDLHTAHWSVRNIGNEEGTIPASRFSIAWDLLQVILLMYVLVSVPLSLSFDVTHESGSAIWWWEAFVDMYFVIDICAYQTGSSSLRAASNHIASLTLLTSCCSLCVHPSRPCMSCLRAQCSTSVLRIGIVACSTARRKRWLHGMRHHGSYRILQVVHR